MIAVGAELGQGYHLERRADDAVARWEVTGPDGKVAVRFVTPRGDTSEAWRAFRSARGDVLVADRYATTMGIGIESWALTLFHLKGGSPVQLEAQDWGLDGVVERNGKLEVLATDWTWPSAGPGVGSFHFLGGWFAYAGDRLVPRGDVLARPYLFSFERERGNSQRNGFWPSAHWLAKAHRYPGGDPRVGKETAPRRAGVVKDLKSTPDGITGTLGGPITPQYVGENGRLWPLGHVPPGVEGRAAELATYADFTVLWLGRPVSGL